jgi:methylphosphotriester-DNA--protein-cysteine methyltransferase
VVEHGVPGSGAPGPGVPEFWRDPALPFAESRRACRSLSCYRLHAHDTLSLGAVDEGRTVFTGAAQGPVELRPGSVVVIPARRAHACNPAEGRWSYQMVHLDPGWARAVLPEAAGLLGTERRPGPVRVLDDPDLHARFDAAHAVLFSTAETSAKEEALIELLGDCLRADGRTLDTPVPDERVTARVHAVLAHLRGSELREPLDRLAEVAQVGRYRLIREFRAVTGLTPIAWQLNERVLRARAGLRDGADLAGLAHDLGFVDQSHLHRVFAAHTAATPGVYRGRGAA